MPNIMVDSLPNELFPIIQDYLDPIDYRSFLNTTKIFTEIKFATLSWSLTPFFTEEVLSNRMFYHEIIEHMKSPEQQLSLFLIFPRHFIVCLHETTKWNCYHFTMNCKYSHVYGKTIGILLNHFQSMKIFELMDYRYLLKECSFPYSCQIFQQLQEIRLVNCLGITNEDLLIVHQIPKIFLQNLLNIVKIEKLFCQDLFIVDCLNLRNVMNSYQSFEILNIFNCPQLQHVELMKGSVQRMIVSDCIMLTDIIDVLYCQRINIIKCPRIQVLPLPVTTELKQPEPEYIVLDTCWRDYYQGTIIMNPFALVTVLILTKIQNIAFEFSLFQFKMIRIEDCTKFQICLESTGKMQRLHLKDCQFIELLIKGSISDLCIHNCEDLTEFIIDDDGNGVLDCEMENCSRINFTKIKKLKKLSLINVVSIMNMQNLEEGGMENLLIKDCRTIRKLSGLTKIDQVTIDHCPSLMDISGLGGNRIVRVISCPKIQSFENLINVPNKEIVDCANNKTILKKTMTTKKRRKKEV